MLVIGTPDVVRVSLPSRLNLLGALGSATRALCERFELDADSCDQAVLAVVEAGTNAITHGHHRDAARLVEVVFECWPDRLEITVTDSGAGFDPEAMGGDITAAHTFLADKGRGIFIMRKCMDAVEFRFDAAGTHCRMVKRRPPSPAR